jgi:hypothetical protein
MSIPGARASRLHNLNLSLCEQQARRLRSRVYIRFWGEKKASEGRADVVISVPRMAAGGFRLPLAVPNPACSFVTEVEDIRMNNLRENL